MQRTPRVYPASPDSQPSPPPSPSPMTFSYEFMKFQCGNHDTREKLEFYQNFIMRLLGELETLSETMCTSCQQKCASSTATQNQLLAAPNDSMRPLKPRRVEDAFPRIVETGVFGRSLARGSSLSSPPIIQKIASVSSPLVKIKTGRKKLSNKSNDHLFYAERDASADTTFHVSFVYSFRHENAVRCVCFSRDGRYLAVGTGNNDINGSIVIYEVESHQKYCELREYATQYGSYTRPSIEYLCFSSDGRYLAVVDDAERIIIWDVPKRRIRSIFHGSYQTSDVRFSPRGHLVALWTEVGVVVLNMRDNTRRMSAVGSCFDFNPGGRLIATGKANVLMILDLRSGEAVKRWNGQGTVLRRVKFTLDGKGLLCVYRDMVEKWDVSYAKPVLIKKFHVQTDHFYQTAISPDHRLVACSNVLLDIHSGKPQYTFKGHNDFIYSVDFSAVGTYLAMGSEDGFVSLWKYIRT